MMLTGLFLLIFGLDMALGMALRLADRSLITPQIILACVPGSASCDGAPRLGECRTASSAASAISTAFDQYQITNVAEQAALISLMAFESADFKYQNNYFPGNPGQGSKFSRLNTTLLTSKARNMQSAAFNVKYAQYLALLPPGTYVHPDQYNQIRSLLTGDDVRDFGSSAWFLTQQCQPNMRNTLQTGTQAAWEEYITGCVGTTVTSDRLLYWQRAVQALGG